MNYIKSLSYQFTKQSLPEVVIKSRGKFISKAVDLAEVAKNKFLANENLEIKNVKIDSEEFESKEGKKITVSTIEILMSK